MVRKVGIRKGNTHKRLSLDNLPDHVLREIVAKRAEGCSYIKVRDFLEDVHGYQFHENTVTKWLHRRGSTIAHVVWGTPEFKNMVAQEYSKVLTNAREVSDILVDSLKDIRAVNRDNLKDGRIKGAKELNTTAMTFLEYFKEIKNVLKDCAGVEELDVGPELVREIQDEGLISVRKVRPD